jgi:hypothetical protein
MVLSCACLCLCSGTFVATTAIARSLGGQWTIRTEAGAPAQRQPTATARARPTSAAAPAAIDAPTATPRPIERAPLPAQSAATSSTLEIIQSAIVPREDLAELAVRFKGVAPEQARVECKTPAKGYDVGDTREFTLSNEDDNSRFNITAELRYKTRNVYMWVEQTPNSVDIDRNALRRAADMFDSRILPASRAFFGDEARPGVDCDPRLYILHATGIGSTVGGYFSSPDGYPRAVREDSNEAEMFVVNAEPGYNGSNPGSRNYMSTLAHELQHMISYNQVHAPELWLEEGAAQLAERINGYADEVATVYAFANNPGTQLNTWSESSAAENSAHYGGAFLFWSYLYDRFGEEATRLVARLPGRDLQSLMRSLAAQGIVNPDTGRAYTFEDLFADFVIANYMGRQAVEGGAPNRFSYADTDVPPLSTEGDLNSADYPYEREAQVSQFGTHYYQLRGNAPIVVTFTGSTAVPLLPMAGADGPVWWSNRADASNPRLTREVDLRDVARATLNFRTWYRLERDYDYAYVSVSADGGRTWQVLTTTACLTTNPNGANLGCGMTGPSGAEDTGAPEWVDESVDLTAYAGRQILLRFEMVTDAGVNREGIVIDDIEIPELDYRDSGADDGWTAEGFVRIDTLDGESLLPQAWRAQVILFGNDGKARLARVPLTAGNAGALTIDLGKEGAVKRAVLAVSAATLVTTEPGSYRLTIRPAQ